MARFVGLDVSQKLAAICVVDETGRRLWRGQCPTDPAQIVGMTTRLSNHIRGVPKTFGMLPGADHPIE